MTRPTSNPATMTGQTRLLAIISDPIAQVRSPEVFNPRIAEAGRGAILVPLHAPAPHFDTAVRGLLTLGNLDGLVVTHPFKTRILPFADLVLTSGLQVGAINALRRQSDGSWTGDMFDGLGLLAALESLSQTARGRRILLLGAGGAGSAIAFALAGAGAAAIGIFDVVADRAASLASRIESFTGGCRASAVSRDIAGCDLLINATPVGMAPGLGMPPMTGELHPGIAVIDIVPKPSRTALIARAQAAGCPFADGEAMIIGQADAILSFFGITYREDGDGQRAGRCVGDRRRARHRIRDRLGPGRKRLRCRARQPGGAGTISGVVHRARPPRPLLRLRSRQARRP
jgi:shikimate dehydrogenase